MGYWNVPNFLTLLRMVLVPVFVALVAYGNYQAGLLTFVVAGLTDALDGFIARHWNLRTSLGAILDPLADKFLLVSAFLTLSLGQGPARVPPWLAFLVIGRDLVLLLSSTALWLHGGRREFRPSLAGKATTVVQSLFVALALFDGARGETGPWFRPLVFLTLLATSISGLHYLVRSLREHTVPPG